MVGVPGRSKGCHTCLKRRIKCDESRPTCKRCEKAGYVCLGYDRKLEIRFHTFEGSESAGNPAVSAKTTKHTPLSTTTVQQQNLVFRSNQGRPTPAAVPQELSLVAFRDDVQFSYLFDNFVWSSYGSPWLQMAAAGRLDALSLEACRAFSLSIFGKHHHQRDIEVSGAMHYEHTVRALSSRLSHVGSPGSEGLIVPITILLMHSSTTPDPQASAFHIQGLLKLVQICGPKRFAVNPLRLAFESCRATLITIGLITKTRSFLEQSVWIDEPWSVCGQENKSSQNQLVDILAYVPGFLEDQARLDEQWPRPSTSEGFRFRLDLVQRIEYQVARLYNWRWHWEEINPHSVWEVDPEIMPSHHFFAAHRPRRIRNTLIFSSFSKAIEISLYNAVLLCLLGLLWSLQTPIDDDGNDDEDSPSSSSPLQELLSQTTSTSTPLHLPGTVDSLIEPAIEICRAFEFQLLNVKNTSTSTSTALFWLFPLGLASKVLEDNATREYMAWIKDMLDSSQITRGYGTTGQNTAGFGFYKFPQINRRGRRRRRARGAAHSHADAHGTVQRPMIQPQYDSETLKRYSDSSSTESGYY
ncbi:hypothetical protein LTR47_007160 [Exophiala xenobiotica]|nr:hypothetical protein LTR47_007160 [Exophiala xenobiotica]KAK5348213.1 hypothetical protein LTR61_008071 [Exophiala xenobiotica]KAK5362711.1 hypothetical protein LTR11_009401 [Exophiala xenobiotica]KAK5366018.1 hypothetical protein LTS03_008777 [Exophiala xenobiotica]